MVSSFNITSHGQTIKIKGDEKIIKGVFRALRDIYPKRYFPYYELWTEEKENAEINWKLSEEKYVTIEKIKLSKGKDKYVIKANIPKPYENDSPYFFLLQVFSRLFEKAGYLMFQDTIALYFPKIDKTALILGYPHSGKSTLIGLAIKNGIVPLTGENTVLSLDNGSLEVIGGSRYALISPMAIKRYLLNIEYVSETKSGYKIINLDEYLGFGVKKEIDGIFLIHSSFSSVGFNYSEINKRRGLKLLWQFASSIIKGLDFYRYPASLSDMELDRKRVETIEKICNIYESKMFEVFGSHKGILNGIIKILTD